MQDHSDDAQRTTAQRGETQLALITGLAGLGLLGSVVAEPTVELLRCSGRMVWQLLQQVASPESWIPLGLFGG